MGESAAMRKASALVLGICLTASADESGREARIRALEEGLARMQQELAALRAESPAPASAPTQPAEGVPLKAFYNDGIKFRSDDGDFGLSIGGRIIENGRFFVGSNPGKDTFYNKETQIEMKGKIYKRFKYEFEGNLTHASTLNNSFVEYEHNEFFAVKIGQFKEPFLY